MTDVGRQLFGVYVGRSLMVLSNLCSRRCGKVFSREDIEVHPETGKALYNCDCAQSDQGWEFTLSSFESRHPDKSDSTPFRTQVQDNRTSLRNASNFRNRLLRAATEVFHDAAPKKSTVRWPP